MAVVKKHNLNAKFWKVTSLQKKGHLKVFSGVYKEAAVYNTFGM